MKILIYISLLLFIFSINMMGQIGQQSMGHKFFIMAKQELDKENYTKSLELLKFAQSENFSNDSISKYEKIVEYRIKVQNILNESCKLYQSKNFLGAYELYSPILTKEMDSIKWVNLCNSIVEDQKRGYAITKELAAYMNKYNPNFFRCKGFKGGLAFYEISYKTIWFNKRGEKLKFDKSIYNVEEWFRDDIFSAKKLGENCGLVNLKSEWLLKPNIYHDIETLKNGLAKVRKYVGKHLQIGYIDNSGNEVIPCKYDDGGEATNDGLIRVKKGNKWGYIDTTGTLTIEYQFKNAKDFSEGFAVVQIGKKYGYINRTGEIVISPMYDGAWSFANGYAAVRIGDDWFFINNKGKNVFNKNFGRIGDYGFREGLALVKSGKDDYTDTWGYINLQGNYITPCIYGSSSKNVQEGFAVICRNGKYGYINSDGKETIPPIYTNAESFSEGFGFIRKEDWSGLIDKYGTTTFDYYNE